MLPEPEMRTLSALVGATEIVIVDDQKVYAVLELGYYLLNLDHMDALRERGWIAYEGEAQYHVTEQGRYWAEKWQKRAGKQMVRDLRRQFVDMTPGAALGVAWAAAQAMGGK